MRTFLPLSCAAIFFLCLFGGGAWAEEEVKKEASLLEPSDDDKVPEISDADKASVVGSGNDFAYDLYNQLNNERGNVFFSPSSINDALAMTFYAARAQTVNEMQAALHFHMNNNYTHEALSQLLHERTKRGEKNGYALRSANALWVQKEYKPLPEFVTFLKDKYETTIQNVEFRTDPEGASNEINAWVDEKTAHKIHTLVTPEMLSWSTKLVITNAVYFKADWETAFAASKTHKEDFYITPSQSETVYMMNSDCPGCRYAQHEDFQVLALPYKGGDIEMVIFLPRDRNGMEQFEEKFNPESLRLGIESLQGGTEIAVHLPRFKVEASMKLKEPLKMLGIQDAFDPLKADFSGISGKPELYLSDVVHKAYINVDENGSEAAAATAAIMAIRSALMQQVSPTEFRADHPFIFLLRDVHSGEIYFMDGW